MNEADILRTVNNIVQEKRLKFAEGNPVAADDAYMGCIDALRAILQTGDVITQNVAEAVESAIGDFEQHLNLGIIIGGKFVEIVPALAGIHNIVEGCFTSSKFVVLKRYNAMPIIDDPVGSIYPPGCWWDYESSSLISLAAWYRRHPEHVVGLLPEEREKYNLEELFIETMMTMGNN